MKKHLKHPTHRAKKKTFSIPTNFFYALIILIIVAVGIYCYSTNGVIAKVEGQKIYAKQVDALYNSLPPGSNLTKAQITQRLVDTKVLAQYARNRGYTLSDDDFDAILADYLASSQQTKKEYLKTLQLSGATEQDVKDSFIIKKFLEEQIIPQIKVSDAEVAAFFTQNPTSKLTTAEAQNVLLLRERAKVVSSIIASQKQSMKIWIDDAYAPQ
ncbi:MAG TPA: SurA N-terminal domain-containing protein [Candidatus Nanoarchaeia archaeon]|nr:SurA N-terminal domain-containing protein [Candidatus Nanoarchaeia archaeon]